MTRPSGRDWRWAAILLPVSFSASSRLGAVDLAYLLRAGTDMLQRRELLRTDTFTFSVAGTPWLNQQWLGELVLALALARGGWLGLAILRAALVALSFCGLLLAARARGADERAAAWLVLGGAALALPAMNLRAQLFGVACFALAAWILAASRRSPRLAWWLVPLAAAWANLHGSFPLLFVLGGAFLLDRTVARDPMWRSLLPAGLVAAAATLLNPYGVGVWHYVAGLTANRAVTAVEEWQPPGLDSWSGTGFLMSLGLAGLLVWRSRARPSWPWLAALLAFAVLGLASTRGTLWWALLAPVVLAPALPAKALPDENAARSPVIRAALLLVAIAGLARWVPWRDATPAPGALLAGAPVALVDSLARHLDPGDHVFAAQEWGSWVEYALPRNPVAVDSRIELFPPSTWAAYASVAAAATGWRDSLVAWEVKGVLVSAGRQPDLLRELLDDPDWRAVGGDRSGAAFVRP